MNEQQIRALVQQELLLEKQSRAFSQKGKMTTGTVTFSSARAYTFNVNFEPSVVIFYGTPFHKTGGSTDIHSLAIGHASLGKNLAFQPNNTSSVVTGGQFEIVQSCSSMYMSGSGNTTSFAGLNDQNNLIYVASGTSVASIVAEAQVTGYSSTSFTVTVKILADGWTIIGNYFVM